MCGEKVNGGRARRSEPGSPPRVRGEAAIRGHYTKHYRITPACAGRRLHVIQRRDLYKDHPRVCGEKAVVNPRFQSGIGSPPRVRGEDNRVRRHGLQYGITPACAGRSTIMSVENVS